jgi:hypothetical protein
MLKSPVDLLLWAMAIAAVNRSVPAAREPKVLCC